MPKPYASAAPQQQGPFKARLQLGPVGPENAPARFAAAHSENVRPGDSVRLTAWVRGRVQGVGFRRWTRSRALEFGLVGWARNAVDGRVEVVAEGPLPACVALLGVLRGDRTPGRVDEVVERFSLVKGNLSGFSER